MSAEPKKTSEQRSTFKLFVGSLREQITEENLREYFSKFGVISKIRSIKDHDDLGKTTGSAYIFF